MAGRELMDDDCKPNFEQKGVDMRIGLDIASMSSAGRIDRILLVSAGTDLKGSECRPQQRQQYDLSVASSAAEGMSTPIRRTRSPCCARAAMGHAAAPPSSVMKARRFTAQCLPCFRQKG